MNDQPLWPFLFEVNIAQRRSGRERTLFVTIEEDGTQHWVDHSGRFRRQGFGGMSGNGKGGVIHFRGDQEISEEAAEKEKEEFTISVEPADYDALAVQQLITSIGKPWLAGWTPEHSSRLHAMLEEA